MFEGEWHENVGGVSCIQATVLGAWALGTPPVTPVWTSTLRCDADTDGLTNNFHALLVLKVSRETENPDLHTEAPSYKRLASYILGFR